MGATTALVKILHARHTNCGVYFWGSQVAPGVVMSRGYGRDLKRLQLTTYIPIPAWGCIYKFRDYLGGLAIALCICAPLRTVKSESQ
jgi:hypothetical protein